MTENNVLSRAAGIYLDAASSIYSDVDGQILFLQNQLNTIGHQKDKNYSPAKAVGMGAITAGLTALIYAMTHSVEACLAAGVTVAAFDVGRTSLANGILNTAEEATHIALNSLLTNSRKT